MNYGIWYLDGQVAKINIHFTYGQIGKWMGEWMAKLGQRWTEEQTNKWVCVQVKNGG